MATNDPTNWQRRLSGETVETHSDTPDYGFYRVRSRDKTTWRPVAYWWDEATGELRCHLAGQELEQNRACELWPFASTNPITHEIYLSVIEGGQWPDVNEAVAGHNRAPVEDSPEAIDERIADLGREAEKIIAAGAAQTQAAADQASDVANTLGELEAMAVKLHKAAKEPHLEAGRAVDRTWFPLRDKAADIKTRLKRLVVTPFLRKQDEERQKTLSAEIAKGTPVEALPQTRTTAGSTKRSTGLRTQRSAEIADYAALLAHLAEHPEIKETVQRIANASAKVGVALPGMKIVENKVAA